MNILADLANIMTCINTRILARDACLIKWELKVMKEEQKEESVDVLTDTRISNKTRKPDWCHTLPILGGKRKQTDRVPMDNGFYRPAPLNWREGSIVCDDYQGKFTFISAWIASALPDRQQHF